MSWCTHGWRSPRFHLGRPPAQRQRAQASRSSEPLTRPQAKEVGQRQPLCNPRPPSRQAGVGIALRMSCAACTAPLQRLRPKGPAAQQKNGRAPPIAANWLPETAQGAYPRVSRLGSTASWEERFLAAAERLPPWGNWLPGAVRHQRPASCSWNRLEELRNEGSWRRRCTSTRWTDRALAKWPRGAVPRSASAISVPLPGPSSTTLCGAGDALSRWTETTAHVQLAVWGGLCCSRRLVIAASCA